MKSIRMYILERGGAPIVNFPHLPKVGPAEKNIDFSQKEINMIRKDMTDKNGQFYKFIKDKVDKLTNEYIEDYLYNQCLNDDRCTAEFASYIEMIIGRHNYSLEQVQQFINTEDLI